MRYLPPILLLLLLPSCATVMKGTTQTVAIDSNPHGAKCTIDRTGARLADVTSTPAAVLLKRNAADLVVTCNKDGFSAAQKTVASSFNGATFGNILLGGVIGVVVDASTGANYSYPEAVQLELGAAATPTLPPLAAMPATPLIGAPLVQPVSATVPLSRQAPPQS